MIVTVAKHFTEQGFVDVNNKRLIITSTPRKSRHSDVTDDFSITSCTVEVSGIPATKSEEYLRMYFESEKRSGGGELVYLQYDQNNGMATITFLDRAGTLSTCVGCLQTCVVKNLCWATEYSVNQKTH